MFTQFSFCDKSITGVSDSVVEALATLSPGMIVLKPALAARNVQSG